jgi:hypothetical protein
VAAKAPRSENRTLCGSMDRTLVAEVGEKHLVAAHADAERRTAADDERDAAAASWTGK